MITPDEFELYFSAEDANNASSAIDELKRCVSHVKKLRGYLSLDVKDDLKRVELLLRGFKDLSLEQCNELTERGVVAPDPNLVKQILDLTGRKK